MVKTTNGLKHCKTQADGATQVRKVTFNNNRHSQLERNTCQAGGLKLSVAKHPKTQRKAISF